MARKKYYISNKGFTLIELLVSIVLLAIIFSAFFPFFTQAMKHSVFNQQKTTSLNMAKELLYDFQHYQSAIDFSNKGISCRSGGVEISPNTSDLEFPRNIYSSGLMYDASKADYYYEVNGRRYYPDITICQEADETDLGLISLYRIHIQVFAYRGNEKVLMANLYSFIDKD